LEDVRVRYEEEIIPIPLFVIKYITKQGKHCDKVVYPEVPETIGKKEMRESLICNYDDTGQRVEGMNRWLRAFVSNEMVLYLTITR
jgi:hypothetical protein